MTTSTEFTIGSQVCCHDGTPCGELRRVVVDPVARTLTHLVIEPRHQLGTGRLVPIDLVSASASGIALSCSTVEFEALENAEETRFLPGAAGHWDYPQAQMLSHPFYELGMEGTGTGLRGTGMGLGAEMPIVVDRVPAGEVEVRRSEPVHASDGSIGRVQGLVVDPADHHVTHFLLDEGHLWGKKRVAIPIGAVTTVIDGVHLSLTKDQVRDLPAIDLAGAD